MGLGQTMLTTAFLVLVTVAAMNANKMIVDRDRDYYEQQAYKEAAILANDLISEIVVKDFNENYNSSDPGYPDSTVFSNSLGPNGSSERRNVPNPDDTPPYNSNIYYDDIDDYNGYTREASSGNLTGFVLTVEVFYVDVADLETNFGRETYFKKIKVTVKNTTYFQKRDTNGDGVEDDVSLVFSTVKAF